MRRALALAVVMLCGAAAPAARAAAGVAPGAPGQPAHWTPADKDGFGTATTRTSKVWHTLSDGELTEVYYPNLGTPAVRDLQLVVSDGRTFADVERDATTHTVRLLDRRSLLYRQIDTARNGRYRIVKTYATDPARSTLLIRVRVVSLTGRRLHVYVVHDPALSNNGDDDSGTTAGRDLLVQDAQAGGALAASPRFRATSNGYLGTSDGYTDLRDFHMDWHYASAPDGNVVQTARTALTGLRGHRTLTLALGFGRTAAAARRTAHQSLDRGFARVGRAYAAGWHRYLAGLKRPPKPARRFATTYDVSAMVLAASENKTFRGAYIASPTMPWAWGTGLSNPSDAYHLVWSRDLYEIATALIADGDRAGAQRALSYLFDRQQKPDGSFPQNSTVDGAPKWTNTQLDETAFPIVLAWQLRRFDAATYGHVKRAADYLVAHGPQTPQERWENQGGYSPATIAAEIAGLVTAADIAQRNHDTAAAAAYRAKADEWQRDVQGWTATSNGPYSPEPYYLRITKDGNPDAGTTYDIGDSGPNGVDQRAVVDPSFLELVRLGIKRPTDAVIRNTIKVVDAKLGVHTPNGEFWHRYDFDGYGEMRNGDPWAINQPPGSQNTIGRVWPIFAGERGEYELAAGEPAGARLAAMARAGNDGFLIPEQVWGDHPPSGQPGFAPGEGTFSATPLAWSHAQFIRLAWSIAAGRPVEQPAIVACRYVRACS
ncbi:MAG TPA: glycoside hydrolase family 15 protein [Solirubrobacteraceae bacterium]